MVSGNGPSHRGLAVVCKACTRVTRLPLPAALDQARWSCPSCGAGWPLPSSLTREALASLTNPDPAPVFSETFQRLSGPAGAQAR